MKKRNILITVILVLLIALSGSALASGYVQATGGDVYVRNAPNRSGGGLDAMQEGQTATYLDSSAVDERGVVWYKVKFEGSNGWVPENAVTEIVVTEVTEG